MKDSTTGTMDGRTGQELSSAPSVPDELKPVTVTQWLHHVVEVETTFKYHELADAKYDEAIQTIVQDSKNSMNAEGDIKIVVSVLNEDEPFDFDSVHHRPLPVEVENYPVVIMMTYKKNVNKIFAEVKTDLTKYDGVTALHCMFNVLEYLETGTCSPYPFTSRQEPLPENQFQNFEKQLARVAKGKRDAKFSLAYWMGRWMRSPYMGQLESSLPADRPARRFTKVTISYKELMKKIDEAKTLLNIPLYALTVNYSPAAALSLCPTLEEVMNKKAIASNISLPPAGTGPPAPMNAAHVEMLFNTVFLNNYGKHKAPQISGKVVGHVWDWSGFLTSFPPFFMVIEIQGSLFFSWSAPPADFDAINKAGIFDGIGDCQEFRYRKFYVRGK
jgi:hypothetical protein